MSIIDELSDWQRGVLEAAGCIEAERNGQYESSVRWFFTKDWKADQARVALAVLPDGARLTDKDGRIWGNHDRFRYITDEDTPYNIIILPDEPPTIASADSQPQWTVDALMQAMREGRQFVMKKEGFLDIPLRQKPSIYCEIRVIHALNPASGWTIEEIVS